MHIVLRQFSDLSLTCFKFKGTNLKAIKLVSSSVSMILPSNISYSLSDGKNPCLITIRFKQPDTSTVILTTLLPSY